MVIFSNYFVPFICIWNWYVKEKLKNTEAELYFKFKNGICYKICHKTCNLVFWKKIKKNEKRFLFTNHSKTLSLQLGVYGRKVGNCPLFRMVMAKFESKGVFSLIFEENSIFGCFLIENESFGFWKYFHWKERTIFVKTHFRSIFWTSASKDMIFSI